MPRTFTDLERLISDRGAGLLATATLLTGSRPAGEDLLQSALERTMRAWSRIDGDAEGYLRRAMYHLAVDQVADPPAPARDRARRRAATGTGQHGWRTAPACADPGPATAARPAAGGAGAALLGAAH